MNTHLRIVSLIEPSLCLNCRFAHTATVTKSDGTEQKMLNCKRLDCDNWEISGEDDHNITIKEQGLL